jgi:hypothetical protein
MSIMTVAHATTVKPKLPPKAESEKAIKAWADKFGDQYGGMGNVSVRQLLTGLNEAFPLGQAGMGPDFKGAHNITLEVDSAIRVNIWWGGRAWYADFKECLCSSNSKV